MRILHHWQWWRFRLTHMECDKPQAWHAQLVLLHKLLSVRVLGWTVEVVGQIGTDTWNFTICLHARPCVYRALV